MGLTVQFSKDTAGYFVQRQNEMVSGSRRRDEVKILLHRRDFHLGQLPGSVQNSHHIGAISWDNFLLKQRAFILARHRRDEREL